MNGTFSYRTPDPADFSYYWEVNSVFVSDLKEVSEDVYLLPSSTTSTSIMASVIVQWHNDLFENLGSGAKLGWILTWYSDGKYGGTFLRGLLNKHEVQKSEWSATLQGELSPQAVGSAFTLSIALVVLDPGAVSDTSIANEAGLILEKQSRTVLLTNPVPEIEIETVDFGSLDGMPTDIPFHIDITGMSDSPDEPLETGAIRILLNSLHPFRETLDGNSEVASISNSMITLAVVNAVLEYLASSPYLEGNWPDGLVPIGSTGAIWASILHRVLPEGRLSDLREFRRNNPDELRRRIMSVAWSGGL